MAGRGVSQVEEYHKSLKQNASLACSPTRTKGTQTNHFFLSLCAFFLSLCAFVLSLCAFVLSLCAFVKLETLKIRAVCSHFALKQKLYLAALQAAFGQLQALQPSDLMAATSA